MLWILYKRHHLFTDPVQTMLNEIAYPPEGNHISHIGKHQGSNSSDKVSHQGSNSSHKVSYQGSNPKSRKTKVDNHGSKTNDPNIRNLKFFEDKTIDIRKFKELTAPFDFDSLDNNQNLNRETSDQLKYVLLKKLKVFYVPGSEIQKVNDFQLKLELKPDHMDPWNKCWS